MYLKQVELTVFCVKTCCIAKVHITKNTSCTTQKYFAEYDITQYRRERCFFLRCTIGIPEFQVKTIKYNELCTLCLLQVLCTINCFEPALFFQFEKYHLLVCDVIVDNSECSERHSEF